MKKKISLKDWNYIGIHNAGAKWVRPFCVYTLEEVQRGTIKQEVKIGWFGYLLMFIPVHVFKVFWCLWDGGLKEFEFAERYLGGDYLGWVGDPTWEKAKEIWEK